MSTRPDLVGVVASARALGTLSLLAGATGALPVLLGHTRGMSGAAATILALLLFGLPFAWFAGARRSWYRERLEAAAPTPLGAVVVSRDDEFRRVARPLAKGMVAALVVGLFVALLASLFHPDTPNDVAPSGYNTAGTEPGLPSSPLEPMPTETGFRWGE